MAPIPEGWLECPKHADQIINNFICFKTPLKRGYHQSLTKDTSFTPIDAAQIAQEKFGRRIGLWIDLTFTDKYYHGQQVEKMGITYRKIKCEGGGEHMSRSSVNEFNKLCDDFLEKTPDGLIAVHCTHGYNRTGFLICGFLVYKYGYKIADAIAKFRECRPNGIFRQSVVDQLCKWYGSCRDPTILASPLPPWSTRKRKWNRR